MEAGANEQARPCGNPEQPKAMALLKLPELGVAVTVRFPDPPDAIVNEEGVVPNVRVGDGWQFAVKATGPDIWLVMLGLPTACTNRV
jgi:hypothetical protein